ncbi:hypothetical protein JZ751_012735, partial [Albula glossodonta]
MYPLTPVSPGVQPPAMYHVQVPHMPVSQNKPYRPGKVPNMPQQRPDQHHPQGTPTMMHPATAAGPPIVAPSPAYSAQYFPCSPQQFSSQPLLQQMPHYQSQAQHVFSPVMQSGARMMAPPTHGQPSLVSSSTTQYGEQTHTMYAAYVLCTGPHTPLHDPRAQPPVPQTSYPSAQQAVYIHPQQVQHGYNPSHMAHVQQVSPAQL